MTPHMLRWYILLEALVVGKNAEYGLLARSQKDSPTVEAEAHGEDSSDGPTVTEHHAGNTEHTPRRKFTSTEDWSCDGSFSQCSFLVFQFVLSLRYTFFATQTLSPLRGSINIVFHLSVLASILILCVRFYCGCAH